MYYIQNRITGLPAHPLARGTVEKCYSLRILAEQDADKANQEITLKAKRIDVVELSKSARLYMENQARLSGCETPD